MLDNFKLSLLLPDQLADRKPRTLLMAAKTDPHLKALEDERCDRCVEIGSGSGYVICSVALLLEHCGIQGQCIAVDINPAACYCTQQTLRNHEVTFSRFCQTVKVVQLNMCCAKDYSLPDLLHRGCFTRVTSCGSMQGLREPIIKALKCAASSPQGLAVLALVVLDDLSSWSVGRKRGHPCLQSAATPFAAA
jgi:hypothetical protein